MPGTAPEAASFEPSPHGPARRRSVTVAALAAAAAHGACAAPPSPSATPANRPVTEVQAARSGLPLLAEEPPVGASEPSSP